MCSLLQITPEEYIQARDGLIEKDLIAFDGTIFQVLDLPSQPIKSSTAKPALASGRPEHPSHIARLIRESLREAKGGP